MKFHEYLSSKLLKTYWHIAFLFLFKELHQASTRHLRQGLYSLVPIPDISSDNYVNDKVDDAHNDATVVQNEALDVNDDWVC